MGAKYTFTKNPAVAQDLALGTDNPTTRGIPISGATLPYLTAGGLSISAKIDLKADDATLDGRYAALNGSTSVDFKVPFTTTDDGSAINRGYFNSRISSYMLATDITHQLTLKAELNGSSTELFSVANPTIGSHAVSLNYLLNDFIADKLVPSLAEKADKVSVILKAGADKSYVPSTPQDPADKRYVDQKVTDIGAGDMRKSVFADDATADEAVFTTKNVGNFAHPNGTADADLGVMKLSQFNMVDADLITHLGIGIFIGIDIANGPPATAGIPVAIEQMDMNGQGVMIGQRATSDVGQYTRFGFDLGSGMLFSQWSHSLFADDYADPFTGGTLKMVVSGTDVAFSNTDDPAVIP